MNKGVREAIRYLEHAIDHVEDAAADTTEMNIYGAFWTDMANAAARCASSLEHKKAASDGSNTGSGNGDHLQKDDSLNHKSSVDEKPADVKTGGSYITVRSIGNGLGHFECAGDMMDLACGGAAAISGLAQRLPRGLVVAAILSGCDHAGITMGELAATYEEAHGHV